MRQDRRKSGLDFARLCAAGERLQGTLQAADLPRFADSLPEPEGELHYAYAFSRDVAGRQLVDGKLSALVALCCQRCMRAKPFDLSTEVSVQVAWSDEDEQGVLREREPLRVPEGGMTLQDMLDEDAVLMLPFAPRCENPDGCGYQSPPTQADSALPEPDDAASEAKRPNPFAALAALKDDLK